MRAWSIRGGLRPVEKKKDGIYEMLSASFSGPNRQHSPTHGVPKTVKNRGRIHSSTHNVPKPVKNRGGIHSPTHYVPKNFKNRGGIHSPTHYVPKTVKNRGGIYSPLNIAEIGYIQDSNPQFSGTGNNFVSKYPF